MNPIAEDILMHYGVKRRSGRYPWGSGDNPYQHSGDFLSRVEDLKKTGMSEKEIAEAIGLSTTELRIQTRLANHERRQLEVDRAKSLREDGLGYTEIGRIMGKNESSIRALLDENTEINKNRGMVTADILRKELESKKMIDVGAGVEKELGVSANTLNEAIYILEREGYKVYGVGIPQPTNPGHQSNTKVLCTQDVKYKDVYNNIGDIQPVGTYYSKDGGSTYSKLEYPSSISSDRVYIRYGDKGGINKDGVIELHEISSRFCSFVGFSVHIFRSG